MGCPTNAKQSMLVTTIPATLDAGGELLYLARADKLLIEGDQVVGIDCLGMDERCVAPNGKRIRVKARHYVLAGGGINTQNVGKFINETGTHSVHASARSLRHDTSVCGNPEIFFGGKLNGVGIPENEYKVTDSALVQNVVAAIEAR